MSWIRSSTPLVRCVSVQRLETIKLCCNPGKVFRISNWKARGNDARQPCHDSDHPLKKSKRSVGLPTEVVPPFFRVEGRKLDDQARYTANSSFSSPNLVALPRRWHQDKPRLEIGVSFLRIPHEFLGIELMWWKCDVRVRVLVAVFHTHSMTRTNCPGFT